MNAQNFAGTKALIRLFLRRDRVTLPLWVGILSLNLLAVVSTYTAMFDSPAEIREVASAIASTPSLVALTGPVFGQNLGALVAYKMGALSLVMVALMSLLTVIRHTRGEEEAGRFDLVGSSVVGRHAPLAAGFIVAFGANLVMAAAFAIILISYGLPLAGSLAFSLAWAACGVLFAAIAGVAAQLFTGAGSARATTGVVLGLAFLARAIGDVYRAGEGLAWMSWLSPVGWAQRIRPWAGEQWWVLALFAAATAVLVWASFALSSRRDVGAGYLRERQGKAAASSWLRNPMGLAWRLNRTGLAGWTAAFALCGYAFASAANSLANLGGNLAFGNLMDKMTRGGGAFADQYFTLLASIYGFTVTVYAIQAVMKLRSEETAQRADMLLAGPVSRLGLAASHFVFAFAGPAVIMAVTGVATGLGYAGTWHEVLRQLGAAMAQIPAVWTVTALAAAFVGLLPGLAALSWVVLVACLMLGQLGDLLKLDQSVMRLSPWTHLPMLPGGEATPGPFPWLTGIAVVLTIAGLAGFKRRDVG